MNTLFIIILLQLLTLIPSFSETAFSPVLVSVQSAWGISIEIAELSFSLYLSGLASGLLFWGILADRYQHRQLLTSGLAAYCLSSFLCWLSPSINFFLIARFCQGFSAVIASIMTLVIIRQLFSDTSTRARMHSYIGMSLSVSPALGPLFGMHFANPENWQQLFLYLSIIVAVIACIARLILPGKKHKIQFVPLKESLVVINDYSLLYYSAMAGLAISNAMVFFTLSPYYYEVIYHLSATQFSMLFLCIAASWLIGSLYSQALIHRFGSLKTIQIGCYGANLFSVIGFCMTYFESQLGLFMIPLSILSISLTMIHTGTIIPNCISLALSNQNKHIGAASSLMGFTYNIIAAIVTTIASFGPQTNTHYFHLVFVIINFIALLFTEQSKYKFFSTKHHGTDANMV